MAEAGSQWEKGCIRGARRQGKQEQRLRPSVGEERAVLNVQRRSPSSAWDVHGKCWRVGVRQAACTRR